MLGDRNAIATIGVKDIQVARTFYGDLLALESVPRDEPGVVSFKSGASELLVYESQYAGTNQATAITWIVEDIEAEVRTLETKGVSFEHYDFPGVTREGNVHVFGTVKNAWFKDPDGNILSIVGQKR